MACYGVGTALESAVTLAGNTVLLTKLWYVAGAVLGGYPLAQGSLYLLTSRRFANRATAVSLPRDGGRHPRPALAGRARLEAHRPSGAVLAWGWVRLLTPFINGYAVVSWSAAQSSARGASGRARTPGTAPPATP